jgi:hypothetical protein
MATSSCKIKSNKKLSAKERQLFENFLGFCKEKLDIKRMPVSIEIVKERVEGATTGAYYPSSQTVSVLGGNRLFLDVMRSVAHELTHHKQNERGTLQELMQEYPEDLYSPYENEAYEKSGNLIKEWVRKNKESVGVDLYKIYF